MNEEQMTGYVGGNNPGTVFAKLSKVMGEVHRIPKNGENKFNNYKYATESDAADHIRPLLAEHGLGLGVSINRVEEADNGRLFVYGDVIVGDGDGNWIRCGIIGEARDVDRNGKRQDKGVYKCITGAVKYWLFKTFLISTGDDPEADQNNPPTARPDKRGELRTQIEGAMLMVSDQLTGEQREGVQKALASNSADKMSRALNFLQGFAE